MTETSSEDAAPQSRDRAVWLKRIAIGAGIVLVLSVLILGAFPVSLLRGVAERRLSAAYGAPVHVGALTRDSLFSFNPEIAIRDVRVTQPGWAGRGDLLRLQEARVRLPVWPLLTGRVDPQSMQVTGLDIALVRRSDGTDNWSGNTSKRDGATTRPRLESLTITNSRFSLKDAKRRLDVSGTITASDTAGLRLLAAGTFDGSPAKMSITGGRILANASAMWPIDARITSPALNAEAHGTMAGPFNFRDATLNVTARAPSLKKLDYLIEAGLFGTQPIDLAVIVRHKDKDWLIDRLGGSIGRSRLTGEAKVLKRDGRTWIDATINASQLDLDDLADDEGQAAAAALRARIGPRAIPNTKIDLSKMGPTDGVIRFNAVQLLFRQPSVFRSARGRITLDHKVLTIHDLVVGMTSGRVTGMVKVNSRDTPTRMSTDLRIEGVSLDKMIGDPATISGSARGKIRVSGTGATIRQAFADADGKAAFVSTGGSVKKAVAYALGQDLGKAIGQVVSEKLDGQAHRATLRCAIMAFSARRGVLTPSPLAIDTGVSVGRGTGRIVLDGETIALTLTGASKQNVALRLVDPIRIGGTLTDPRISVANGSNGAGGAAGDKPNVLKVLGRSIGDALGLRKAPRPPATPAPQSLDCQALTNAALK